MTNFDFTKTAEFASMNASIGAFAKRLQEMDAQQAATEAALKAKQDRWYKSTTAKVGFGVAAVVAVGAAAAYGYEHITGNPVMSLLSPTAE